MPKLRVFSAHEVCRILQEHGFVKSRQSGNHIIMRKQTTDGGRTVIVPNHPEIRRGMLKSIIIQIASKTRPRVEGEAVRADDQILNAVRI